MNDTPLPTFDDVRAAHGRIRRYVHRTPVLTCATLDRMSGARLLFKCENLQKVGAFKIRGAANAVFSLGDEAARAGVATHSSGNHGAALAQAAAWRGIKACVVMPANAPLVKQRAVEGYGGDIVFCEPGMEARDRTLRRVVGQTGMTVVHPYNDAAVIAGQGTAAVELLEDAGDLDAVMAPVGGGGLLAGTAIACAGVSERIAVYGAEPANADDARRSFMAGRIVDAGDPDTIADGLRASLGTLTFEIIRARVTDILTVTEDQIVAAMRLIWERMKLVVEPSCAVPLAAVLAYPEVFRDRAVGLVLTGGNVDLDALPWARRADRGNGRAPDL
jgi:threonine dehydratase